MQHTVLSPPCLRTRFVLKDLFEKESKQKEGGRKVAKEGEEEKEKNIFLYL